MVRCRGTKAKPARLVGVRNLAGCLRVERNVFPR
jgi:hypothetical protein